MTQEFKIKIRDGEYEVSFVFNSLSALMTWIVDSYAPTGVKLKEPPVISQSPAVATPGSLLECNMKINTIRSLLTEFNLGALSDREFIHGVQEAVK